MFRSGNFIKGRPTLPCRRRFPIKRYISILHSRPSSSQPRCRPSFLSRDPRLRDTMEKFRTREKGDTRFSGEGCCVMLHFCCLNFVSLGIELLLTYIRWNQRLKRDLKNEDTRKKKYIFVKEGISGSCFDQKRFK